MEPGFENKTDQLRRLLSGYAEPLIAYSGGVDSAFLLWFTAHEARTRPTGILADSPSLKRSERQRALDFAEQHGLPVEIIETSEMDNPDYAANPVNRCYFCKHALFDAMDGLATSRGGKALFYGENADDADFDRPGGRAAREFEVRAPLKEVGLTKSEIRMLSRHYSLEVAEKRAQPCLASRIQQGVQVTPERLSMVESAEQFLAELGFEIVRVRHRGTDAYVQVGPHETPRLLEKSVSTEIAEYIRSLGFEKVAFDPEGYQGAGLL